MESIILPSCDFAPGAKIVFYYLNDLKIATYDDKMMVYYYDLDPCVSFLRVWVRFPPLVRSDRWR